MSELNKTFIYDVALSFAGEDREYVKQVADLLRSNGVRVFYDEYERANLWGKELIEYLEDIYKNKSRFVIIFVSKAYLAKDWTNHERKSALNRAFKEKTEYILPVKLDYSSLPGLHESIGYLSGSTLIPQDIANIFLDKMGMENISTLQPSLILYRLTKEKYTNDLSGIGASIYSGRWNKKGNKIIYCSASQALATLELVVHVPKALVPKNYFMVQLTIPSRIHISKVYETELGKGWKNFPPSTQTQEIGNKWIKENESCILSVPSAIVKGDRNYLLNPNHEDFSLLKINKVEDFEFDERMF